jgi:hypothetical protein
MQDTSKQKQLPLEQEQLGLGGFLGAALHGIGVMLGLGLLWGLEKVRNEYFRILDRLKVKARPRGRVSAFPPGIPRRHKSA